MAKRQPAPKPFSVEELEELAASPALQGFDTALRSIDSTLKLVPSPGDTMSPGDTGDTIPSPGVTVSSGDANPRRFLARTAQDGHTVWEQDLYQALWGLGKGDDYRVVTAGHGLLSRLSRLSDKAVKRNLESLVRKLAIEEAAPENCRNSTGRTYRVYSYRAILERRRQAGLIWVVRNRQGVSLSPGDTVGGGDTMSPGGTQPPAPGDTLSPSPGDTQTSLLGILLEEANSKCMLCRGTGISGFRGDRPVKCGCTVKI